MKYLQNLNLNGNAFDDFKDTVMALKSLSHLKSLYINLHQEEQVDLIMRTLQELEFLNGLKVEREILEEEQEDDEDEEGGGHIAKGRSPVKEEPYEEDQEDDDYNRMSKGKEQNESHLNKSDIGERSMNTIEA